MVIPKGAFLLDSNSFIAPYRLYYSMSHFPSYWTWLSSQITNGDNTMIIPKIVFNELTQSDDELSNWVKDNLQQFVFNEYEHNPDVWNNYGEIINYIHNCGCYKNPGKVDWDQAGKADPVLIAIAKSYDCHIVTFEEPSNNLSPKNPMKKEPKIPDVASHFGANCVNLYYLQDQFKLVM